MASADQLRRDDKQTSTQAHNISKTLPTTREDANHTQQDQIVAPSEHVGVHDTKRRVSGDGGLALASDLWSTAYREAVNSLEKDIDVAILMGANVAQLFKDLEDSESEATQDSLFLRGVAYLRSIQVPLEKFKLALDLASPLGSLDPTSSIVFGVVQSVTAVGLFLSSITVVTANEERVTDTAEHRLL